MNPPRCKSRRRINALSVAQMFVELQLGIVTMHELVTLTGLSLATVRNYVLTLHKLGGCHIASWETDSRGRHTTPAFTAGKGKDVPAPKMTEAERHRRHRDRMRQVRMQNAVAGIG